MVSGRVQVAQEVVPCFPSKLQTPQRMQCLFFSQWQGLPSSVQHQQLQPDQRRGQAAGQSRPAFWPAGHHRPCRGTVHPSLPPVPPDTEDVRQGPRAGTEPRLPRDLDTESVAPQTGLMASASGCLRRRGMGRDPPCCPGSVGCSLPLQTRALPLAHAPPACTL